MSIFLWGQEGSQFLQLKKWTEWIIHLFIIQGIVLIRIQFSPEWGCVYEQPQRARWTIFLNGLCLMGSEIHFSWAPSRLRYTCHIIKCEIQSTVWWTGQDFIPGEIIYFLSSRLLSCHLDEWLIRQSVKRIMIWLGNSGGGERGRGGVRASKAARCEWGVPRGGQIVSWYNTGQEESILLTVKIHLVRTKHSKRPELSNSPYLLPVL